MTKVEASGSHERAVIRDAFAVDRGQLVRRGHGVENRRRSSRIPPDLKHEVQTQYASQVHVNPIARVTYLFMNMRVPPFDDVRVRHRLQRPDPSRACGRFVSRDASGIDVGRPIRTPCACFTASSSLVPAGQMRRRSNCANGTGTCAIVSPAGVVVSTAPVEHHKCQPCFSAFDIIGSANAAGMRAPRARGGWARGHTNSFWARAGGAARANAAASAARPASCCAPLHAGSGARRLVRGPRARAVRLPGAAA